MKSLTDMDMSSPIGHTPRGVWGLKLSNYDDLEKAIWSYPARGMGIEINLSMIAFCLFDVIPREGYGD